MLPFCFHIDIEILAKRFCILQLQIDCTYHVFSSCRKSFRHYQKEEEGTVFIGGTIQNIEAMWNFEMLKQNTNMSQMWRMWRRKYHFSKKNKYQWKGPKKWAIGCNQTQREEIEWAAFLRRNMILILAALAFPSVLTR